MKTYKQFNEAYHSNNDERIDIREFFANLKKFSYDFKDYYKFKSFLLDAKNKIDARKLLLHNNLQYSFDMSYFGYTNDSETFYMPIIDNLTRELHKIFSLIVDEDYEEIYEYFNSDKSMSRFEYMTPKYVSFSTKTYNTEKLARAFEKDFKPYYETKIRSNRDDKKEITKILEKLIEESNLSKDYNFSMYGDWFIDVRIIKKVENTYTPEEELKIQEAREFGMRKYEILKWRQDNKETFIDGMKYNL